MNWQAPQKPSEWAEAKLVEAFVDGTFPIDSNLPGERDLAGMLGVTRPTLRETLQRLARDGWVEIRQGRPTRVRNYWQEGQLAVLVAMVQYPQKLPPDIVPNLLEVRLAMAPVYTRQAIRANAGEVAALLASYPNLPDSAEAFTSADWELHQRLCILSANPVYTMILNGFRGLYLMMGLKYFRNPRRREASRGFYANLLRAAQIPDAESAEETTRSMMARSIEFWAEVRMDE
jgi:GntR family negative regulator for fad regulon and positive regulator of fabA